MGSYSWRKEYLSEISIDVAFSIGDSNGSLFDTIIEFHHDKFFPLSKVRLVGIVADLEIKGRDIYVLCSSHCHNRTL